MIFQSGDLMRLRDKLDTLYFNCNRPIPTKHGKVRIYREGVPPTNSHDPQNAWLQLVT